MSGIRIRNTRASGSTTKCTVKESLIGWMAGATLGNTKMIKSMGLAPLSGLMAESMKDTGKKANSMVEANTISLMENSKWENGLMARKSNGSIQRMMKL